jgi:2-polyprenyl-3-methyl-5-hydroxy-6-metoxy-1,4-benzoquinol methylase
MDNKNLYLSGEYLKKNHSYHKEDSEFKWQNLIDILKKTSFNFDKINSIVDIGCGSGQVLVEAKKSNVFKNQCSFEGYDINPEAIKLAKNNSDQISFFNEDFIKNNTDIKKDIIIAADVFEHIQDPYNFLKELKNKGNFFLFNIPLEISLLSMIRKKNIYKHSYKNVGHLHFYNKRTSLLLLESVGFKVLNHNLVNNRFEELKVKKKITSLLINIPQYITEIFNKNIASSVFGGYSLVVLAKK